MSTATVDLVPGTRCLYQGQPVTVQRVLDLHTVLAQYETGKLVNLPVHALLPVVATVPVQDAYPLLPPAARQQAEKRRDLIAPLLITSRVNSNLLAETAARHGIGQSTLRRWVRAYRMGGLPALVPQERHGGRKQSRLSDEVEAIVQEAIETHFLTSQRKTTTHVLEEIARQCHVARLPTPSLNSLRRRIGWVNPEDKMRRRFGAQTAQEQFAPLQETTLVAPYPLAVVQLDHALLNIVVVDETTRRPLSRPWLTVAVDVYSRMVVGLYLSLEVPGTAGTGLCIAHAILPKETWLNQRNIPGSWPCWGTMKALHTDNAKEFHGTMLARACAQYEILPLHRLPHQPRYGGHVERLIKTLKFKIHQLAGTTLGTPRARWGYRPHQKAVFSLPEFERWLVTYIINVYHRRRHSALGKSPYERWQEGILGGPDGSGIGQPTRYTDELQVRLDFMPFVERTIQQYGVLIDHFYYYADVLRPYINSVEEGASNQRSRRKFVFKLDPRDLSRVHFLDPVTHQYHLIPLTKMGQDPMSTWRKREAERRIREGLPSGERLTQERIFEALDHMNAIEAGAVAAQRAGTKMTKKQHRLLQALPATTATVFIQKGKTIHNVVHAPPVLEPEVPTALPLAPPSIQPFDDIDDGTSDLRHRRVAQRAGRRAH